MLVDGRNKMIACFAADDCDISRHVTSPLMAADHAQLARAGAYVVTGRCLIRHYCFAVAAQEA